MTNSIQWAITSLQARRNQYLLADNYYRGNHDLSFATEKFRNSFGKMFSSLAVNICPAIVDVTADRLQVLGFEVLGDGYGTLSTELSTDIGNQADEIWRHNRMAKRSGDIHMEALKCGDAYVIVWPDQDNRAVIYPQTAGQVTVCYDPENPGYIIRAAKWFLEVDDKGITQTRLNIYTPTEIQKYITQNQSSYTADLPWDANSFKLLDVVPNPYGKVPVFAFHNNAPLGQFGSSVLKDIIPLQNAPNKVTCDQLVALEYNAYPQRYVTGLEVEYDEDGNAKSPFISGADRLFAVTGKDAKFGDFAVGDGVQFVTVQNQILQMVAAVSGIPPHYLSQGQGGWPSGEALKTSEHRLTSKVKDLQTAWEDVWSDCLRFCLEVEGRPGIELSTNWADTSPKNVAYDLQNAVIKYRELGVDLETVQAEIGYSTKQIEDFQEKAGGAEAAGLKAFNRGLAAELGSDV